MELSLQYFNSIPQLPQLQNHPAGNLPLKLANLLPKQPPRPQNSHPAKPAPPDPKFLADLYLNSVARIN